MQKLPDDLIEKFLSGNCTKEEAAIVWNYLRKNPDESYLLGEFEQTDGETPLPSDYKEEMLNFIIERTDNGQQPMATPNVVEKKRSYLRPLWYGAAAAALILIFKVWVVNKPAGRSSGEHLAIYDAPESAWIMKNNTGKKDLLFTLPDSSKVRLSPGARMRYRKGFGTTADRDVEIAGKAFFDVAKNEKRPFTLYSEGLQTSVLGTSFFVNANPYSDKVSVKLYTGKVRVSLQDSVDAGGSKEYYLLPGQELVFTKSSHNIAINGPEKHTEEHTAKAHNVRADTISNWYMFNNQTLSDVFDQLSAIYSVDIEYSRDEIRDMYFIGKLEKKDSLNEIIRDIAILNHLTVTNLNGKYIIKKGKP